MVWDLHPHLVSVDAAPVHPDTTETGVTGTGLATTSTVEVDGSSVPFTVSGTDHLAVSLPSLGLGQHTLSATTAWGDSNTLTFAVVARPTISSVTPSQGSTVGGYHVVLRGTGFTDATAVAFGATPASSFSVVDDTTIMATVPAGSSGEVGVTVTTPTGTSLVVQGAHFEYVDDGSLFHGVAPQRLLDSRGSLGGWDGPLQAGSPRSLVVAGVGGVPADATSVVLNVTSTDSDASSFVTVYPHGTAMPNASNVNFPAGHNVANLATVRVGDAGQVDVADRSARRTWWSMWWLLRARVPATAITR